MQVIVKIDGLDNEKVVSLTEDVAGIVKKYDADYFKIEANEE